MFRVIIVVHAKNLPIRDNNLVMQNRDQT